MPRVSQSLATSDVETRFIAPGTACVLVFSHTQSGRNTRRVSSFSHEDGHIGRKYDLLTVQGSDRLEDGFDDPIGAHPVELGVEAEDQAVSQDGEGDVEEVLL